jgi:phytoene dehydrogenase-like protein
MTEQRSDVVVVGGGLAGLTAAATAARHGRQVVVLDGREHVGGRARSEQSDGFTFNQGPHALYRAGAGMEVLRDLGVRPDGHTPSYRHAGAVVDGRLVRAWATDALSTAGKAALARALGPGARRRAEGRTTAEWVETCTDAGARNALRALIRVTSYIADHDRFDAVAALDQLRRGQHNVLYLHGGWQQLVDGLRAAATGAGATIDTHAKVTSIEADAAGVRVHHDGGTVVGSSVIVATGGPGQVARLLDGASPTVARWASQARPVVAACLDVSLRRLPPGSPGSVLGLDQPWYCIPHSNSARLAPDGAALIHAMRYGADLEPDADHRAGLEGLMDVVHPGWREEVVEARFGRALVVSHDRPQPGIDPADRPTVAVHDAPRVFVAGDWITTDGLLADAALASGRGAGQLASSVGTPALAAR